jgi:hypothetical protein
MSRAGLVSAYHKFHSSIDLPKSLMRRASAPLLIQPSDKWFRAKKRLLIVGQETNGWSYQSKSVGLPSIANLSDFALSPHAVPSMLDAYLQFDFAATYRHRNSAFWRAFRQMATAADSTLWTNLFKVDYMASSVMLNCSAKERNSILAAQVDLLRAEVKSLKPSIVIFFSGPRYDQALLAAFPDSTLEQAWKTHSAREVAFVSSKYLPIRTIRTFHPSGLQRSRKWNVIPRLASWISE